jgi:hypothetical protein
MIVFEETHIWDISNSKISQITTTTTFTISNSCSSTFSARNSDLALTLSMTFLTTPGSPRHRFVPAGKQYWYRHVLSRTRLVPATLQITRQIRISRNRHLKEQSQNCDKRSLPSYLPHVSPFAAKQQLTVWIVMIFRIRRFY